MATRPAREAFKHIEISGLPYFIQVKVIQTTVAMAGAMVVVTKIEPSSATETAAAPLNPYQPNHRINKKDSAYRLGGDEYCVLCYDRFPDEMEREMELINQKLLSEEEKYNYPIGISYGIVRAEYAEGKSVRLGLTEADRRMYAYHSYPGSA